MNFFTVLLTASLVIAQQRPQNWSDRRERTSSPSTQTIDSVFSALIITILNTRTSSPSSLSSLRNDVRLPVAANACTTPGGLRGVCENFSQCDSFKTFIPIISHSNVLNFLRQRICRVLPREVYVCCPISDVPPMSEENNEELESPQRSVIPSLSECGLPSAQRIVGGNEVAIGSWPWLALIGLPNPRNPTAFFRVCAGSLITRRHVLTAAHCFSNRLPRSTYVRLGEHNLFSDIDNLNPIDVRIKSINAVGYNSSTKENDIALLALEEDVIFNDFVRPICLPINTPERNSAFEGEVMTVVGWGRQAFGANNPVSDVPREVDVPVRPLGPCSNIYRMRSQVVDTRTLCAGEEGKDACSGDSGGPLNYLEQQTDRYYLAGIVSHGHNCAKAEYPGVYTRVGAFINWILDNLN